MGAATAVAAGTITVVLRDPSTAGSYPPCPFKAITGLDCPGCGALRGAHALFTEGLGPALDHNLLLVPAALLALWLWIVWAADAATGRRLPTLRPTAKVSALFIGIVVVFTVARNLPGMPLLPA